jgi:hypothetical protein
MNCVGFAASYVMHHSALKALQDKNPTLCNFVDEVCPGLDTAT